MKLESKCGVYFVCECFYDKIARIKEEFNILIGSRSRFIKLIRKLYF